MSGSTYKLKIRVARKVRIQGAPVDRDVFSHWLWDRLLPSGLMGVHEGTLLSSEAARIGLETESWTLDAAEAPRERDWIAGQDFLSSELFFETAQGAESAAVGLREETDVEVGPVEEQVEQDWDAEWKASFLNSGNGVAIPPLWRILPPWVDPSKVLKPGERALKINPGAGFGTGTHETTRLCLQAIAECVLPAKASARALDFGSGSGILSIGAALLGLPVDAVEIDSLAIDNAVENAKINSVEGLIRFSKSLGGASGLYSCVIANILRPVLLEFAGQLVERIAPGGTLILSGLIESDVAEVRTRYSGLLRGAEPEVRALGEWRALIWRNGK